MNTSDCMLTVVKNTSGASMELNFWPPHGNVVLASNAEVSIYGDIYAALLRYHKPVRNLSTFNTLLAAGDLEIVKTPAVIVYDDTNDRSAMLIVDDDELFAVDPCWAATEYSSPIGT